MTGLSEIRVLIVGEDLLARAGLGALLDTRLELDVVGQTDLNDHLTDEIDVFEPDIILLDLGWSAGTALARWRTLPDLNTPLVVLLADESVVTDTIANLRDATNAFGLLARDSDVDLVTQALTAVDRGLIVIDPIFANLLTSTATLNDHDEMVESLTPRESDVLNLLARGLTNKAIGQALGITDHTVKFHVNAIMGKLNAQSRTDAVMRATRAGLIAL